MTGTPGSPGAVPGDTGDGRAGADPDPDGGGHGMVRPFIMVGGRTQASRPFRLETLVQRTPGASADDANPERRALLALAGEPVSVAELAAELDLVVGVVTVLLDDLLQAGLIEQLDDDPDHLEVGMLTRMAEKIRSL